MSALNKILGGSKGMTLLEVMMAVAVLGILILFASQMTAASSRIGSENARLVQMVELAQAEAERIRACYEAGQNITPVDNRDFNINYVPRLDDINYNGTFLKITVGDGRSKYDLVLWLPPKD
ncbi:MAG: prepilin-type N-terminal cleavage/methylation domain-containing protein [Desulfotomaculum sp.]|nr:prepilin-type N-terminal cleavage/methylation domain-containing protein [Desulfotomaculum sp.]